MGGNKSAGQGTNYQSSQVQIPPEVMARYNSVNATAEAAAARPWQAYGGEFVAPVNQTQQGGINTISGAAGVDTPYFQQATSVLDQSLGPTGQLYGQAAQQVGQGYGAGTAYTQQGINTAGAATAGAMPFNGLAAGQLNSAYGSTQPINNAALGLAAGATGAVNPGALDIGQYMSPYNEGVVQSTLGLLRQDQTMQQNDLRDQQIMEGSFGGDRSGVGKANLQRQQDLAYGNVAAQLYNQNYGQALGAAQQQQGVGLAAGQANRAALASGAQNLAGIGQQQFGQGLAAAQGNLGVGQQIYGQGQGLASSQMQGGNQLFQQGTGAAGANAGLASGIYGTAAGAAGTYGQLGTQQLQNQLAQGQAQIGAGTVEQQTRQAEDTARYNQFLQQQGYPFQVAQFLANIAMGTGAQSGSTTNTVQTQAQPFFSDERLKENVHVIGKTHDGQPIIRFNYKGDASTQIGLSAQETEKHHPDAVGLASGYKTVDYDAATRDSIAKAGGGGLGGGMADILAQQKAMFPGAHDPRGVASGVGPHGVAIAPLKATAPQATKVDMSRPQQQSGAKQTIDSALGMYGTGKGLAAAYGEGKDTLVGSAGKKAADGTMTSGTPGWFGTGGKWAPGEGSASKLFSNDNTGLAGGNKISVESLAPPADPAPVVDPTVGGLAAGVTADPALASSMDPELFTGMFANRGGRMKRAAGGSMPYAAEGYIPEELYKPIDPDKPDEGGTVKMGGPGGGQQKDGTGKAIGSLAGMGLGAMFGMPGVGSMLGGTLGGMFNEGGRVGLATGGLPDEEDERLGTLLPFRRKEPEHTPMPRMSPVSEAGLAAGSGYSVDVPELPPKDEGSLPGMDAGRLPRGGLATQTEPSAGTAMPFGDRDVPVVAMDNSADSHKTARSLRPGDPYYNAADGKLVTRGATPWGGNQQQFPESGTPGPVEGLAAGQIQPAGGPAGPALPDGTPISDIPPAGLAAAPAAGPAPSARPTMPPGFRQPGGGDVDHSPGAVFGRMLGQESGNRHFGDNGAPLTSSKGAAGIAQVLPSTGPEAAKLAGLPWNPELFGRRKTGDPALDKEAEDYNRALGQAYYNEQNRTFGDPYMAAAAYNAGPGAVQAALKQAQERGGSFLDYLPKETQDYVAIVSGGAKGASQKALALNAPADRGASPAGLAAGAPAPAAQETPDFIERAGNWIDRNQRPIMSGLAFIGNMLGSKSHQLTGAIGDGLAAAAPMYMATGFKETELKQGQERIDIGARAQYMAVLARQQQMQNDFIRSDPQGRRNPELDAQMQQTIALINGKGGIAAVPAGAQDSLRATPPTPARTDLAPTAPAATPPQAPAAAPTPGVYTGGPPPITAEFLAKLDPKANPDALQAAANRQRANGDREGADQLERQSMEARARINQTGQGVGPGGEPVKLPGWDEYKALQSNLEPNQKWLRDAEGATEARVKARRNVENIKSLIEEFESGTGTDIKAKIAGVADALGIARPQSDSMDQAAFKSFVKDAYNQILSSGAMGRDTDQMRAQVEGAFASPTLPPEANKKILSQFLGNLTYEDEYAKHMAEKLKGNQLIDQKIVGDQWRGADKDKNNPGYHQGEAYKNIAVMGATPENSRDIKDGHQYMLKPQEFFNLQGPNGKYSLPQIQQAYKEAGKRALKFRAKRNAIGGIDWEPVK